MAPVHFGTSPNTSEHDTVIVDYEVMILGRDVSSLTARKARVATNGHGSLITLGIAGIFFAIIVLIGVAGYYKGVRRQKRSNARAHARIDAWRNRTNVKPSAPGFVNVELHDRELAPPMETKRPWWYGQPKLWLYTAKPEPTSAVAQPKPTSGGALSTNEIGIMHCGRSGQEWASTPRVDKITSPREVYRKREAGRKEFDSTVSLEDGDNGKEKDSFVAQKLRLPDDPAKQAETWVHSPDVEHLPPPPKTYAGNYI